MRDESQPCYGQVWEFRGREVFIFGEADTDAATFWVADRQTGVHIFDARLVELIPTTTTEFPENDTFVEMTEKCITWARSGNAGAAWWLGWRYEGVNHPKHIWYTIAAIRMNPKDYSFILEHLYKEGRYGSLCEGVPAPDISFMKEIPEFQLRLSPDWQEAIANAEVAIHQPSTTQQIDCAMDQLESGSGAIWMIEAWSAGLTESALESAERYKAWRQGHPKTHFYSIPWLGNTRMTCMERILP